MGNYSKDLKNNDCIKIHLISLVRDEGLSIAQAARVLQLSERTCQGFFNADSQWAKDWWNEWDDGEVISTLTVPDVKVLFFDIETAPCAGAVWSLWNNNVSLNQLERDWYVLSWSAKWQHEDTIMYQDKSLSWDDEDDSELLKGIWKLLDEADIVIGQNSKRFDEKKLNARFIMNGMKPPSSYRSIDTLEIAKRHFGFTSNKLEYMTDKLCTHYKKLTHGKFAGFELWKQCLKGNPLAWEEMEEYNIHDVLALEELYDILKPWYKAHPNLNVYRKDSFNECVCGSSDFVHSGYHYTNLSKFDKFKCNDCGAEVRGKINLLSKEKRESLTRNIL